MKFSNLYPKTNIDYEILEYPGVKKSRYRMHCQICSDETRWYDKKSHHYICSRQCLEKARESCKNIED